MVRVSDESMSEANDSNGRGFASDGHGDDDGDARITSYNPVNDIYEQEEFIIITDCDLLSLKWVTIAFMSLSSTNAV